MDNCKLASQHNSDITFQLQIKFQIKYTVAVVKMIVFVEYLIYRQRKDKGPFTGTTIWTITWPIHDSEVHT